jgi:hypothetical protein
LGNNSANFFLCLALLRQHRGWDSQSEDYKRDNR